MPVPTQGPVFLGSGPVLGQKGPFHIQELWFNSPNVVPSPSKNSFNLLKNSLFRPGGLKITLQTPPFPGISLGTRARVVSSVSPTKATFLFSSRRHVLPSSPYPPIGAKPARSLLGFCHRADRGDAGNQQRLPRAHIHPPAPVF